MVFCYYLKTAAYKYFSFSFSVLLICDLFFLVNSIRSFSIFKELTSDYVNPLNSSLQVLVH